MLYTWSECTSAERKRVRNKEKYELKKDKEEIDREIADRTKKGYDSEQNKEELKKT